MRTFFTTIILTLVFTGMSLGQTNVSPGDGTLSAAIKAAASEAVLVLENGGAYTESTDSVYVIDKVLTIKVQDSEGTQAKITFEVDSNLVAGVDFFLLKEGASLTLDGLELYGMSDVVNEFRTAGDFMLIEDNAVTISATILNCYFHHANGRTLDAGDGGSMETVTIDNSVVTDCDGGPYFKDADLTGSITVTNSTFMNITDRFVRAQSGDASGHIEYCTVYNASGKRIIMAKGNTKQWVVTNSIFSTFTGSSADDCIRPGDNEADSLAFSILHSDVGLHKDWEIVSDTSSADPMFTDAENGDLKLKAGSPALTMGSDGGAIGDPRWVDPSTAIGNLDGNTPDHFELSQNYPNPFNPTTQITFTLAEADYTTLTVHNILGQVVATLVNKQMTSGSHEVSFDAADISSGIYFYVLRSGQYMMQRKMVLIK